MNITRSSEINKLRKRTLFNGCVHKDAKCDGISSKAHSIQNHRYLDKISVNSEVMCIDFGKIGLSDHLKLSKVGKDKASIFTGFCNYHDHMIFRPIESFNYNADNVEQNFLFSYRAFALSYYERYSTYELKSKYLEIKEKEGKDIIDLKTDVFHYKKHLDYIEHLRKSMNQNLDNKKFSRNCTNVLRWPQNYGIAATSMFFVDKDTIGNIINSGMGHLAPMFFTIIPQDGNTYVLLSYLAKDKDRYAFVQEQIVQADIKKQKMLISNMLAMEVENFFISPEKWDSFSKSTQKMFLTIMESTMGHEKPNIGYFSDFNLFI